MKTMEVTAATMVVTERASAIASDVLYREAASLDEQDWDTWLSLFHSDCTFWVPTWLSEHQISFDPQRHLSHIYYS